MIWQRLGLALLACALVAGCGFKLRGTGLNVSAQSVFVSGADPTRVGSSEFAQALRRAFAQRRVTVTDGPEAAEVQVRVLDERRERRNLSVTGQARAAEWELTRAVQFSAVAGSSEELIEPRWIEVKRFFRVDRDNIVGSNEEQRLVEQELTRDLVDQVLRSVNQVLAERAAG